MKQMTTAQKLTALEASLCARLTALETALAAFRADVEGAVTPLAEQVIELQTRVGLLEGEKTAPTARRHL